MYLNIEMLFGAIHLRGYILFFSSELISMIGCLPYICLHTKPPPPLTTTTTPHPTPRGEVGGAAALHHGAVSGASGRKHPTRSRAANPAENTRHVRDPLTRPKTPSLALAPFAHPRPVRPLAPPPSVFGRFRPRRLTYSLLNYVSRLVSLKLRSNS